MLDDQKLIGNFTALALFDDNLLPFHCVGIPHPAKVHPLAGRQRFDNTRH
jgi:hypothetical protein